jgi:hypothetical protein
MKIRDAAKRFEAYDRATTKKMAEHNRSGGDVRTPVRSRWAAKVPQNREDLQELKALGTRLKTRYKPK